MKLIETIPIVSPGDAARRAVACVPAPYNDLAALQDLIYELCLNVQQWAEAPGTVSIEEDESHIIVTVLDGGVGIPATMRRAFPDLDNEEAVERALEIGGTSSGQRWRGFGLAGAVDLSNRYGFSIYLESQDVAVWSRDGILTFCYKSGGAVTGTRIQIVFSRDEAAGLIN